jgi:hypothetical protein
MVDHQLGVPSSSPRWSRSGITDVDTNRRNRPQTQEPGSDHHNPRQDRQGVERLRRIVAAGPTDVGKDAPVPCTTIIAVPVKTAVPATPQVPLCASGERLRVENLRLLGLELGVGQDALVPKGGELL